MPSRFHRRVLTAFGRLISDHGLSPIKNATALTDQLGNYARMLERGPMVDAIADRGDPPGPRGHAGSVT